MPKIFPRFGYLRTLGEDHVITILVNSEQFLKLLSSHSEQSQQYSLSKINQHHLQRLIANIQTLVDALSTLKGNASRALLHQLGYEFLKNIVKDGYQLASILIIPETTRLELLHTHLGTDYLNHTIKDHDQLRKVLAAVPAPERYAFLINTLGPASILSKVTSGTQLKSMCVLLPGERERSLLLSQLANHVTLRALTHYRDDKEIHQALSASVAISSNPLQKLNHRRQKSRCFTASCSTMIKRQRQR